MALLAVRISVTFHPSLDVVGGARNSGFLGIQPGYLGAVKVKDLTFPEKVWSALGSVGRDQEALGAGEI